MSRYLYSPAASDADQQIGWARQLLPPDWANQIIKLRESGARSNAIIFHRRALWLVLQLSVLCGDDGADFPNKADAERQVAKAMFMASDLLNELNASFQRSLIDVPPLEWMIAVVVPLLDFSSTRINVEVVGRACLLWDEVLNDTAFMRRAKRLGVPSAHDVFQKEFSFSLAALLRSLVAVFTKFAGHHATKVASPILFEFKYESDAGISEDEWIKSLGMLSQTPDDLALQLLRSRQSWSYDVTPLSERPLIEVEAGKYCCPDLNLLAHACIDRVYYLLQRAYGKQFGAFIGVIFESYVERVLAEFLPCDGPLRTFLRRPRFQGSKDEAADGMLLWHHSVAVMEYKASLLTTRQRMANSTAEVLQGIGSIGAGTSSSDKKGVVQIAANIRRLLDGEHFIQVQNDGYDLTAVQRIFPVLVCLEERLSPNAVRRWLQSKFSEAMGEYASDHRIQQLIVLTIGDLELLTMISHARPIESLLWDYSLHLVAEADNFTGTFYQYVLRNLKNELDLDKLLTKKYFRKFGISPLPIDAEDA